MTEKIYIPVDDEIKTALLILAKREMRDPRYQATVLIRQKLIELGLLPSSDNPIPYSSSPHIPQQSSDAGNIS